MHFRHLDLNLLVALDALLSEKNITLAGKRVHLSQSAMSGALSRLRDYFGDELLTLVGRRMIPTSLGERLAPRVRKVLLEIQATVATRPQFDPGSANRCFRLMMSDYVANVLMSAVLPRVERLAPHLRIEILSNDVDSPFDELDRADIDLLVMPQRYLREAHPSDVLFEDEFTGIAWRDNQLLPADGEVSMEKYLSLGHVTVRFSTARAATVDEWFVTQLGHERRVEVITMNFTSVFASVVGTQRVATVHKRLAGYYQQYLPIRLFNVPFNMPRVVEAMQWNSHFDADPGNQWLRATLKEAAQSLSPGL